MRGPKTPPSTCPSNTKGELLLYLRLFMLEIGSHAILLISNRSPLLMQTVPSPPKQINNLLLHSGFFCHNLHLRYSTDTHPRLQLRNLIFSWTSKGLIAIFLLGDQTWNHTFGLIHCGIHRLLIH